MLQVGSVYRWSSRGQPYVAVDDAVLVTWKHGLLQVVDSIDEVTALATHRARGEAEPSIGELLAAWEITCEQFDRDLAEAMRPRLARIRAERAPGTIVHGRVPTVAGAPVVAAPLSAVTCRTCGEEKPWLRPGEQCALCAAPKGAPLPRESEEDDEPELVEAAPAVEEVAAPEEEIVMAKQKFGEGRKPNEWEEGLSSEAVVAWREEHSLSRYALAKLLGTSVSSINAWEHGRAPGPDYQAKIRELIAGPPPSDDEEEPEGELEEGELEEEEEEEDGGDPTEEVEEPEPEEPAPRPARRKRASRPQLPAPVQAPAPAAPLPSWRALALGVLARAARGAASIASELERRAGASS